MLRFLRENQLGISLTELLVTLALLWVVVGAVFSVLVLGEDIWSMGEKQVDAQRQARIAFMRMTKEIRQCYEIDEVYTGDYILTMRGIQITSETLADTGDHQTYQSNYYSWLWNLDGDPDTEDGAEPTIYVNGAVATSGYTIDSYAGTVTFGSADSDRVVKANYTRNVDLKYELSDGQLVRSINGYDGEVVAENVVNQSQSTPIFSQTGNLFTVILIIDKDASKPPPAYTLETEVRLRK